LTGHTLLSVPGEGVNDLITCQRAVSRWLFSFSKLPINSRALMTIIKEDRLAMMAAFRSNLANETTYSGRGR
jgi:hypothetical protein